MKSLLIVGGGIETVPAINLAKEMGLRVVVSDSDINAPGIQCANDYIIASTYDVEETITLSSKYNNDIHKLDGVICIGSDVPLTVASVAKNLNLPGIPINAAKLSSNKILMKDNFRANNIPIPDYSEITFLADLKKYAADWGFPLVIKPVDSRGSRGVLRLTEQIDLDWAFNHSKSMSPSGKLMVERYLEGPQLSTESMMLDGECFTPGYSDRNYEFLEKFSPFIIENGGDLPSFASLELKKEINEIIKDAALSMGISNGIVKGDIVIYKGRPYIIELAARLSGGYFCTHKIPLNSGVNIVKQAIKLAIGLEIDKNNLIPTKNSAVSQRYFFPNSGLLKKINGLDSINEMDSIEFLDVRLKPGDTIFSYSDHTSRAGMVITSGVSRKKAISNAVNVVNLLDFIVA